MIKFYKRTSIIITILVTFTTTNLFSTSFFSGQTGAKLNYTGTQTDSQYNPNLSLQAFFAGQFNFSEKVWARAEFSLETQNLLDENIFNEGTGTNFRIEELSLVLKGSLGSSINYFSTFLGTHEQIGSDIFLQKYFGIEPIASKLTTSWLGLSGSNLYKQSGLGIGDVIKFNNSPIAFGAYAYFNSDALNNICSNIFVFNTDIRFATTLEYFTLDFLCGIGLPLPPNNPDYLIAIEKIYWHAGASILIGNNYTQSLFLQVGIFNAEFKKDKVDFLMENLYLLFEPRFNFGNWNLDLTLYNISRKNRPDLPFLDGSLGANINFCIDSIRIAGKLFTFGVNTNVSFDEIDLLKILSDTPPERNIFAKNLNVTISTYGSTQFLSGELNCIVKLNILKLKEKPFSIDIGFKTKI